tara:strand:+ start:7639 stop:8979 length:1341 start_codon:yes stop_codon:yes gene_type:complete
MKTYEATFKEDSDGVFAISLVNDPATQETFIALSKQEEIKLAEVDKEQKILMGLVLQPDQLIYRNQGGEEFNIVFSSDTIKELSHNFLKSGYQLNSKLEHEAPIKGVSFVESWIVENPKVDKSTNFGMEYPKGSWMATMKCSDEVWNDYVKTGKVQGFSVDAMVDLKEVNLKSNITLMEDDDEMQKGEEGVGTGADVRREIKRLQDGGLTLEDIERELMKIDANAARDAGTLSSILSGEIKNPPNTLLDALKEIKINKSNIEMAEEKLSFMDQLKVVLAEVGLVKKEIEVKLGSVVSGDITIEYEGEVLEAGVPVFVTSNEERVALPDGSYPSEMGEIVVVDGVVTEVKAEAVVEETAAPATPAAAPSPEDAVQAIKSLLIKYGEETDAKLETINKSLVEFKKENETLKAEVVTLSEQPAAKSVKAEVKQVELTKAGRILAKIRQN